MYVVGIFRMLVPVGLIRELLLKIIDIGDHESRINHQHLEFVTNVLFDIILINDYL